MQPDPARALADLRPPAKRSFSQHAVVAAAAAAAPAKLPRTDTASGEPSAFRSPHMSSQPPSSSRRRFSRPSEAGTSAGSSRGHRGGVKHKKKGGAAKEVPPRNTLEGPFHNLKYIQEEHDKSPIKLKPLILETPRSYVNNFCIVACGKIPDYVSMQGTVIDGDRRVQVHRRVFSLCRPARLAHDASPTEVPSTSTLNLPLSVSATTPRRSRRRTSLHCPRVTSSRNWELYALFSPVTHIRLLTLM